MSTKNKKVTTSDILMDYDKLQATLKEESRKTVSALLSEAIKNGLNDAIEDDEDEEKEYEIKDDDSAEDESVNDDEASEEEDEEENSDEEFDETESDDEDEESESDDEEDSDEDKWSEFDKYKVDDDTYDLSGEEDDEAVIKVYKLLKDSDSVIVKKEGNRAELKDGETGAEYVIDFGDENPEVEKVSDGDEESESLNEGIEDYEDSADEFYMDDDDPDEVTKHEYLEAMRRGDIEEAERIKAENPELFSEDDNEDEEEDFDNMTGADEFEADPEMNDESEYNMYEGKKSRKTMKESKEKVLFEIDLGYTDNYQDKDPIEGLSDAEPSKGKNDWDAGAPKGTAKPWAGKGDSQPFDKAVNEEFEELPDEDEEPLEGEEPVEEIDENHTVARAGYRRSSKTKGPKNDGHEPKGTRHHSKNGKYHNKLEESVKKLQKENKMLKEAAIKIKNSLQEAVLVNVNLGQIVKILQENSTTSEEKSSIVTRFNNVKSIKESMALYESISHELAGTKKTVTLEEKTMTAAPAKQINESTVYENPGLAEIRNMMNRIENARI